MESSEPPFTDGENLKNKLSLIEERFNYGAAIAKVAKDKYRELRADPEYAEIKEYFELLDSVDEEFRKAKDPESPVLKSLSEKIKDIEEQYKDKIEKFRAEMKSFVENIKPLKNPNN